MAKQLNVNLNFNANTQSASVAIQKLSLELQSLGKNTQMTNLPITDRIVEAQMAAKELGSILQSSLNAETGLFDLSKFNTQLQNSGKNLAYYGNQLEVLGPKGDQAFLKIAQSIIKTEIPLRRSNGLLMSFATTLKNTARWQISSSILHGFMGAISSAYGYAKKLDESLNNIRIVTGASAEEMSVFAAEANKAARALSTTTTAYTDASLIFYQQGYRDQAEIAERAETVIKMANVTQQNAQVVSDQMTAIWNNFDDGSKSLEYYADVMARLGAETASSTAEIAGGIEKFAGVAETIGLSYEYAAASLATITAETRMSEEVVGTALKTIFARIQGLKLGESLEDGTNLNKYSEALKSVGISIFDTNGELKNMDNILDEMGAKWKTISKDQQVALAQTVAGVRQYTQLVTLMDNWDVMEDNLELAYGAEGALDEQHKIYEEGWKASSDRVKASLESIYSTIIDKEFFTDLNNSFADFLKLIKQIMDAAGGIKGVLAGIGLIVTTVFKEQMATSINNSLHNFKIFSGVATQEMNKVKKEAYDMAMSMTAGLKDNPSVSALRQSLTTTYDLQLKFNSAVKAMSPEQAAVAREAMKTAENYSQMAIELAEAVVHSEELLANQNKIANVKMGQKAATTITDKTDVAFGQGGSALLGTANSVIADAQGMANIEGMTEAIDRASAAVRAYRTAMREGAGEDVMNERSRVLIASLTELDVLATQSAGAFDAYTSGLQDAATSVVDISSRFDQFKNSIEGTETLTENQVDEIRKIATKAKDAGMPLEKITEALKALGKAGKDPIKVAKAMGQLKSAVQDTVISTDMQNKAIANTAKNSSKAAGKIQGVNQVMLEGADAARNVALSQTNFENGVRSAGVAADEAKNKINNLGLTYKSLGSFITGSLQGLSSFAMGLSSLSSLKDTLNNEDLSTYEKILQVMMSLGMAIPMLTTGLKALANGYKFVTSASAEGLTASVARLAGIKLETVATQVVVTSKTGEVMARGKVTDAAVKEAIAKGGTTTATEIDTAATWTNVWAKMAQYWYIGLIIVALGILAGILVAVANAYNADANAAAAAAEKAEESKKAYEETKQAAEDLKNTISDYSDAVNELEKLKKGTLEYKQALIEANDKAIELIQQYEGLAKYATRNDDGLIVISQEGLDYVLESQMAATEAYQEKYLNDEIKSNRAQEKADLTNFSRQYKVDGQDNWREESEKIIRDIAAYMQKNQLTSLIEDDLSKIDSVANANDAVYDSIVKNIDAYASMALQLNDTEKAQALLADTCIEKAYQLQNPDSPTTPQEKRAEAAEFSIFSANQRSFYLSEEEQNEAIQNYKTKKYEEFIGEDGLGFGEALMMAPVMGPDGSFSSGYNPTAVTGSDAAYYAHLMGYDMNGWHQTESGVWDGGGKAWPFHFEGGFLGIGSTQMWDFTANGIEMPSWSSDELEAEIVKKEQDIIDAKIAKIEAPKLLANIDTLLEKVNIGTHDSVLDNLLLSADKLSPDAQALGTTLDSSVMSQASAQNILDNWDQVTEAFEGFDETTGFWQKQGFIDADSYLSALKEWLTERSNISDITAIKPENIEKMATNAKNVFQAVLDGELTSETASENGFFTAFQKDAEKLAAIFPELKEEAKIFGEESLIGTERWVAAFNVLQDKINDLKLDGLIEEAQNASKKISEFFNEEELNKGEIDIEAVLQSQEFETALDSLLDKNYAIDVEIHTQAEDAFNTFETATNNMVSAAAKIGEGYVVAASDIRELNNVFPGIIQNMEDVEDGSVKLNEQIVKDAMAAANAEMGASGESTIAQLKNAATLLRSKQKTYLAMYEAALALSKGEGDAATHTQTILDGLNELENLNNKELSDTKMDNAEAVATDSNVQAEITASNWTSAYEAAADSAIKFAQTAVQAAQVAQKGKGTVTKPDFSVNYQGRNGQSSEAAQLADLKEATENADSKDDYAELATSFLNAADAAGMQANDIEGMIAQIGATTVEGNYQFSNTGKEEDDKTKKQPKTEKPEYKDDSDKVKLEDELERYYYITNAIEDLNRELDSLSNAKDDAWGPDKLAAMDKEIAKLKQVRAANKQYRDEIAQNLFKDKAKAEGYGVQIGTDGIVSNYEAIITQWAQEKDAVTVDEYNSYEDQIVALRNQANAIDSEADKDGSQKQGLEDQISALEDERDQKVKAAEDLYDSRMEALEQYEETRDLLADTNAELEEQLRKTQQLNYEKLMYKVEYKIEVNDSELDLLNKKLEAIEKTIFKDAEAFGLIQEKVDQQYKILVDGESNGRNPYDMYKNQYKELQDLYELGKTDPENGINQDQFMTGLQETQDGLMESYDTIVAMDEKMQEYYGNAIEDGLDLIHTYEEGFDGLLSTLDHYSNVMTLIGQEKNYEGMNAILEGRVEVLNDRIESAERTITDLEDQKALIEAELAKPDIHPDTKAYWEEQLLTVNGALRDEQDALYGYIEEVGEAANQILKNNIDKAMKELRDSITGGVNLEYLMKDMERMSTYQEDYLTNTNKMYETNKMISQAQLAIDKTQNAQAKQRYQEYIKYVEKLQTTEQLSKQELEMAQAKYAILEAEIALEEAKNAKSEVRLTRDSEGNFGYVYTADQDNIASATQTYLDKQNELYNISLEGSKQYREKYLENIQNMLDEVEALEYAYLVDHSITQEEYEKQKLSIQEYYGEQGKSYASLFNAAQWELASSSYSTLMEENTIFNAAQLSENKEHQNAMAYNDAEYIGGLKTGMSGLHQSLETDLKQFNMNSYTETDTNYVKLLERDQAYYTDLEKEAEQAQAYIYGQMTNPSANSAAHHMNEFATTTGTAFDSCETAAQDWENIIKPLNERVGKSFSGDESNEGLAQKIKDVTDESEELRKKLNDKGGLHDTVSQTWHKAHNMTTEWEAHRLKINEVKNSYFELMTQIQNTMTTMANFNGANAPSEVSSDDIPPEYTTPPASEGGGNSSDSVESQAADLAKEAEEIVKGVHNGSIPQTSSGWKPSARSMGYSEDAITLAQKAFNDSKPGGGYSYYYDEALKLVRGYDTGGYTGAWGPEGKLAVLHEKEIVLNKEDTENFLGGITILREISKALDTKALLASLGTIDLTAMTVDNTADQILQQEVTIQANFPNVTDHKEIEMAIDNLINAASQYANRK